MNLCRNVAGIACALLGVHHVSAQFVQVAVQCESTSWKSTRNFTSRCVFGTNLWMLQNDFISNADETWWCTGTNVIRHWIITKKGSEPRGPLVATVPEVGEKFTRIYDARDNFHLRGPAYQHWLAFCSGSFLKAEGRHLQPFYSGLGNAGPYSDRTQTFKDALGLPQRMELSRGDGKLVCVYEVHQSTNFLGWSIPLRFTATQYSLSDGISKRHTTASAIVTSIGEAAEPVVPAEILKAAKHY